MKTSVGRQLIAFPTLLLLLAMLYACGNHKASATPDPARVYTLAPRQTVALKPGTTLRLDHVNDSRCRPGKVCVWAGYLSYSFTLSGHAGDASFVLADDMPGSAKSVRQQELSVTLLSDMSSTMASNSPDYRVSLRVQIR